jgi:hypothetical protein
MLHELPQDILDKIASNCLVEDKVKMNIALPKPRKFNFDKKKLCGLRMLRHLKKRKERDTKKHISECISKFLSKHSEEATVKEFCEYFDIKLEKEDLKEAINPVELLLKDIDEKNLANSHLYPSFDTLDYRAMSNIKSSIYRTNVEFFKALYDNPNMKQLVLATCLGNLNLQQLFFFNLVNYQNESMLKHMMEEGAVYGLNVSACKDYVLDHIDSFLSRSGCKSILLRYFELPDEIKLKILESIVQNMDYDSYLEFTSFGFTL